MRTLSILAVVISVTALALSVVTFVQADARAERALAARERELVERLKPTVQRIYEDFDLAAAARADDAERLEDLLGPLLGLMEGHEGE